MKSSTKNSVQSLQKPRPMRAAIKRQYTTACREEFKYLKVVFTSDGRKIKEINTRIGKANIVLRELCRSAVTKRHLWNTATLSVFESVFVSILTYDDESWAMTERVLFQLQAVEMGFLRRVHGVTAREKVRSCESRKAWNVEPLLLQIERSQLRFPTLWLSAHVSSKLRYLSYVDSDTWPECPRKHLQGNFCWLHPCASERFFPGRANSGIFQT